MQSENERMETEQRKMEEVAKSFNKAMKGIGTDEERIIREIVPLTPTQRQLVRTKYISFYGKDIMEDLKSEIKDEFLETVLGLFTPPDEYEARIVRKAIDGTGTNEKKVIEILCSKDAVEIAALKAAYKKLYKKELEKDLVGEEGGDLGRIFRALASGGRNANHGYDIEYIKRETQALYDAGQGKTGTDEAEFIRIFCSRSYAELNAIFALYSEMFKIDIEQVIRKELSGDLRRAFIAIAKSARNKPGYFAELLYNSMEGIGTREQDLIEVLVRRAHIDLQQIKAEYKRLYKTTLYKEVDGEVSGDFKKLLLALIGKD